jgi:hypothetical protein
MVDKYFDWIEIAKETLDEYKSIVKWIKRSY